MEYMQDRNIGKSLYWLKGIELFYLKSNIRVDNNNILYEFNIVFSETYQTPVLYFIIYDVESYNLVDLDMNVLNKDMLNSCEISKTV